MAETSTQATWAQTVPVLDEAGLNNFGTRLFNLYVIHKTDRKSAEERWMRNLRQFRGVYDPEVLSMIAKDQSKAYPKLTRWKCIGTVARLMQMLFPQTEKNYGIKQSPLPDLPIEQLQEVLNALMQTKAGTSGVDPKDVELTDTEIEKAISEYAKGKAGRMELKIDDDLQEMEYITLARKVVFSAVLYNIGVLKGPLHIKVKARGWRRNLIKGGYEAFEKDKFKPLFEFMPVWSYYPDMTATSLDKQDGTFERHIMARWEVEALAQRPDFLKDRIATWLKDHPEGNYVSQWWETVIKGEPKSDRTYVANREGRKYELGAYYGGVTGHELRASGVAVSDADVGKIYQANAWIIDNTIIKASITPFNETVKNHHVFMFEEDDLSILGNGQCDVLRDSQMAICETARAALDNMSVIGPMLEINTDLLTPGQPLGIRKHKTWFREGEGNVAQIPAVRNITIDSHLNELIPLLKLFLDFADKESGLPPPSLGDTSGPGSEALRTQRNASMFLGAAALPIRDTVRNFDTFTISVMTALVAWNQKYDPNPSRDGDHDIIARGSTSLIAKEVLGEALNEFRQTLTPDEADNIKTRELLKARMRAHDLPEDILEEPEVAAQKTQQRLAMTQAQMQGQMDLLSAQSKQFLTKSVLNEAQARKADGSLTIEGFNSIMDVLLKGHGEAVNEHVAVTSAVSNARKDMIAAHVATKPIPAAKGAK